jgi:arylsulfatase
MSMAKRRRIWTLLLAIVVISIAGYFILKPSRASRPNVLWITVDSLRPDHLGCGGYQPARTPNIDALAHEGVLFTQAIAQSNYTRISVPSIITGRYPTLIDIRTPMDNLDDRIVTLSELLLAEEYATLAILPDLPSGIYQGLETLEITDASTVKKTQVCLDFLHRLDQRPFFLWLYYWDPHAPYQPPEEFATLFQPASSITDQDLTTSLPDDKEEHWAPRKHVEGYKMVLKMLMINQGSITPAQGYAEQLINLYDAEIAFVDSNIKEVVDRVKELGLWENTLVVLNADHGEAFGEHGTFFHGYRIYEEEVRIPLIIKPPRSSARGKVIKGPVRNLDIMPTILDYCRVRSPQDLNGQSLRPFIEKNLSPNLPTCIETNTPDRGVNLVGYRRNGYKLICGLKGVKELYDLEQDPMESENLLNMEKARSTQKAQAISQKQKELLEALLDTYGVGDVNQLMVTQYQRKIDPQLREKLKAQGYIY